MRHEMLTQHDGVCGGGGGGGPITYLGQFVLEFSGGGGGGGGLSP